MLILLLKDFKYRWFEYLLGAVIISVVVAAMIVQHSVTSSAESEIHKLAHNLGKNMLVLPEDTDMADFYMQTYGKSGMEDTFPEKIRSSDIGRHIRSIQSRLYGNADVNNVPVIVMGEANSRLKKLDNSTDYKNVILAEPLAKQLDLNRGDMIDFRGVSFKVAGVTQSFPEGLSSGAFTSLETAQQILDRPGEINEMRLGGCWCRLDVASLTNDVQKLLPGTKAITVASVLKAQKETVEIMKRYSGVIYTVMISIIAGIITILTVSQVRRQLRQIGMLLAIGTPPWIIKVLFSSRAVLVGISGGVWGLLLGFPLTKNFAANFLGTPLSVSGDIFVSLLAVCILVSFISAFIPTFYATKIDPIEVLREI